MALLSGDPFAGTTPFSRSTAVLAAQSADLPQPDQLCGPFAAHAALHGLGISSVPTVLDLALAAGTRVWPHDEPDDRPGGVPTRTDGRDGLPEAASEAEGGTDAAMLAGGVESATDGTVRAVGATGEWTTAAVRALLTGVLGVPVPLGVVANVRTGAIGGGAWDVGHFVVLWGLDAGAGVVAVADSYAEVGVANGPPGCRPVGLDELADGLAEPPGRGVLLLARAADAPVAEGLVTDAGLTVGLWST